MPSGRFLMEDFYYAGGLPTLLRELGRFLHKDCLTVNGRTLWDNVESAPNWTREVIRPLDQPVFPQGGIAVLRGNLAERGAIIKPSAATPKLMEHRGRAVVFETTVEMRARIDDPDLDVGPDDILVLKNAGPRGYPGFPEVGNMPRPKRVLDQGITDMVRISDARMSGTAYGTVILHVSPEAAVGGALALVQTGDMIEVSVSDRRLHLDVPDVELERRRTSNGPPGPRRREATPVFMSIMFCRPMLEPTSTFFAVVRAPNRRPTRTEPADNRFLGSDVAKVTACSCSGGTVGLIRTDGRA